VASTGEGIAEVAGAIREHRSFLDEKGLLEARRRDHFKSQVRSIVIGELERALYERLGGDGGLDAIVGDVAEGHPSPHQVAREVLKGLESG
jgi:LAO/AO transport system kinase